MSNAPQISPNRPSISEDNVGFGDIITNSPRFAPYIYNQPTVNVSFGFTPLAFNKVEKCTYTITDTKQKVIDSTVMEQSPLFTDFFSAKYVTNKTLTNLPNGNYTFELAISYINGTVRLPLNETIIVDTDIQK